MNPEPLFACLRSSHPTLAIVDLAREFSPRLQRQGPACVVCDVSGLGRLLGSPATIAEELALAVASVRSGGPGRPDGERRPSTLTIRIAIAPTTTAALLMTLTGADVSVVPGDRSTVAAALAPVLLVHLQQLVAETAGAALRRPATRAGGLDPGGNAAARDRYDRAFDMARRWGLTTLGELVAIDGGELSARMGQEGVRLQQLAQGRDTSPFVPDSDVPRFIERMELEWPVDTLEPLSFVLARLLDPLSISLERADRGAAALRLDLRLVDRTVHARVLQLPAAMRDPKVLRTLLMLDLESHPPGAAIDIVTLEIDPAPGRVIQYSLIERALPSVETVATLTARLSALVGETRCGSPVLLDTHRPDGFEMRRFTLTERSKAAIPAAAPAVSVTSVMSVTTGTPGTPGMSRIAGTPSANAASEYGDRLPSPLALPPALRRFRPPVAVRITTERGRPVQVAIDRRGMPGGVVERSAGPWRTSGEWWVAAPDAWDRDEWDIALRDGTLCRVFQQRDTGHWFMEGVVD